MLLTLLDQVFISGNEYVLIDFFLNKTPLNVSAIFILEVYFLINLLQFSADCASQ